MRPAKNVRRRSPGHYKPSARMTEALAMVAAGASLREAARAVGLSVQAIHHRMPSDPLRDAREVEREEAAGIGRAPVTPTSARAGSTAKMAAMAARVERGESLFHRDDEPTAEDPIGLCLDTEFDRPAMKARVG